MCIGFIPKNTFAIQVYNNVNIDYRFFVDEDESNAGSLKFKLYDKSGTLNFESKYDANTKQYYFEYDKNNFEYYGNSWEGSAYCVNDCDYSNSFDSYVPFGDEILSISNLEMARDFRELHKFEGVEVDYYWYGYQCDWNFYTYIPMILEETHSKTKKIVFSSIFSRGELSKFKYYVQVFLVNNTNKRSEEKNALADSFLENVDFMRKTMLDYSDELWEELNNGPIASSEIYSDNIASTNYKYINQSIIGGIRNVPEETIDDYANSLPVLSFKKVDGTDSNKDNNIVKVMINPKTWNNGIVVLVISMIVIIGSSIVLIRKRKV